MEWWNGFKYDSCQLCNIYPWWIEYSILGWRKKFSEQGFVLCEKLQNNISIKSFNLPGNDWNIAQKIFCSNLLNCKNWINILSLYLHKNWMHKNPLQYHVNKRHFSAAKINGLFTWNLDWSLFILWQNQDKEKNLF